MTSLLDFVPLFQETVETIRARMDADATAGLALDDDRRIDTREGSFYWDVTQAAIQEIARLWDALSVDVPAAAFVPFAWGEYLDRHGEVFGVARKPAVRAATSVVFAGDPGTLVATGTVVSAEVEDSTIEFATVEQGTTGTQIAAPTLGAPTNATSGGALAAATYTYSVSAYNDLGETEGSTPINVTTTGTTSRVTLDWADAVGATGYRVYRAQNGGESRLIASPLTSTYADNGGQVPGVLGPPELNTSAAVSLVVEAVVAGPEGNVAADAIISLETPNDGVAAVRNPEPAVGGDDEESDDALRTRILVQYLGQGGGTITDYQRWALEHPGVGRVNVFPVAFGPGTVQVVLMTESGDPVTADTVTEVQEDLDPDPGKGLGRAPIGATVTVQTPTVRAIDIVAEMVFAPGYSLDGEGGTFATRELIEDSLREYLNSVNVGDDVIYNHVLGQFFRVPGVLNVVNVTVEGAATNVSIPSDPPQVAQPGSFTLS
jgi:uncharacterized phage protein gp47/JayE